ncbi:MAG: hypothetical protein MJ065_03655 [Oscillospiraceae bacterium]|nr:hypothetical protein [Oscillospiraceae bacterium]
MHNCKTSVETVDAEVTSMAKDFTVPFDSADEEQAEAWRMLLPHSQSISQKPDTGQKDTIYGQGPEHDRFAETAARMQEQQLLAEAREKRRIQSEENRRRALLGAQRIRQIRMDADIPADPQRVLDEIDVSIPSENGRKQQNNRKAKSKQKNPKQNKPAKKPEQKSGNKPVKKRTAGGRYSVRQEEEPQRPNRSRISTAGAVAIGLLTGLLIGTVIYGRVQTNEVYTEIAALQAEYNDLVARNISMKSEMEGKLTVKNIEEYAEKTLGLMPLNQSQIEYIQLQTEDEVIITEPEDNVFVSINDFLVNIWEYLRGK